MQNFASLQLMHSVPIEKSKEVISLSPSKHYFLCNCFISLFNLAVGNPVLCGQMVLNFGKFTKSLIKVGVVL